MVRAVSVEGKGGLGAGASRHLQVQLPTGRPHLHGRDRLAGKSSATDLAYCSHTSSGPFFIWYDDSAPSLQLLFWSSSWFKSEQVICKYGWTDERQNVQLPPRAHKLRAV